MVTAAGTWHGGGEHGACGQAVVRCGSVTGCLSRVLGIIDELQSKGTSGQVRMCEEWGGHEKEGPGRAKCEYFGATGPEGHMEPSSGVCGRNF